MKVFVSFQPKINNDNFEGSRLRKTIKGALEMHDIPYTSHSLDDYDIAHFLGCDDEIRINEVKEKKIPVVISALNCEDDPAASFLDFKKNRKGEKSITLKNKATRVLNKADLVLVPTKEAKELLVNNGITSRIETCLPGVNLSRFDYSRQDEKDIFYRYYSVDKNKKLVLIIGEYNKNLDGINTAIRTASKNKDSIFFFLGDNKKEKSSLRLKLAIRRAPKNLHFKGLMPDDIYRSALMNASLVLFTGYGPLGIVSAVDAMAAKCQLIIRKQDLFESVLTETENAYSAEYSETIALLVKDFHNGKIKPTNMNAYKYIQSHDLMHFGQNLKDYYKDLIENNKSRRK